MCYNDGMEAKDTVMDEQKQRILLNSWIANHFGDSVEDWLKYIILDVAQVQAEISFKAGWEECKRLGLNEDAWLDGNSKGIKEVVGWIERNRNFITLQGNNIEYTDLNISLRLWQAKLKEWGISPATCLNKSP